MPKTSLLENSCELSPSTRGVGEGFRCVILSDIAISHIRYCELDACGRCDIVILISLFFLCEKSPLCPHFISVSFSGMYYFRTHCFKATSQFMVHISRGGVVWKHLLHTFQYLRE